MKRTLSIFVAFAVLYLMRSSVAWACFCTGVPNQVIVGYSATPVVFIGTVTSLQRTAFFRARDNNEKILMAYLHIDEAFKGVDTQEAVVITPSGGCGFGFEVGEQYLLFARPGSEITEALIGIKPPQRAPLPVPPGVPTLETDACSLSGVMSHEQHAARMIRNYIRGTPQPQIDGFVGVYGYEPGSLTKQFRGLGDITVTAITDGQRFETRTDDIGSFLFANLPLGKYAVSAQFPAPYPPALREAELASNLDRAALYLSAEPTARLSGRLLDSEGRLLKASIAVSLIPVTMTSGLASATNSFTTSSTAGQFKFWGVPPGKYILGVSPFIPTPRSPYPRTFYPRGNLAQDAEVFDIELGVIDDLVFKVPPALQTQPITGVVVSADGAPLSKAQVLVYDVEMPSRLAFDQFTDKAGRFSFFGLKGRHYLLQARAFTDFSEMTGIQSQPVEVAMGDTPQELKLRVDQQAVLSFPLR